MGKKGSRIAQEKTENQNLSAPVKARKSKNEQTKFAANLKR